MQLDKSKFARIRCEMYKIMPEPKDFLKSNDPCAAQKKVEGMKALSQFMHCFRSSQSLLWPLKWNRRLLFVIPTVPLQKQWKGALGASNKQLLDV